MKRRDFLAAACAAGALPAIGFAQATSNGKPDKRQFLEWVIYHTHVGPRKGRVTQFVRDALAPAYGRMGLGPIGVFTAKFGPNPPSVAVLAPHPTIESVLETPGKLIDDDEFVSKGASFLNATLEDPAYVRIERRLLRAFAEQPQVVAPACSDKPGRIFELRTYESHSYIAGQKKIDMFNAGGEVALFKKTGLTPVFFGQTLFGPSMPNLTYMLAFEDMAARDAAWKTFIESPEWDKLKRLEKYKDTVSNISDYILRPASGSQI